MWCEDEARLGLKAVARRVWALAGTRPTSCGRSRFESLQVYAFARPASGRSLCLFRPKANAERTGEALAAFATWADPTGERTLVVLVDNAVGHTAKRLVVPANVRLHPLSPCIPELQPHVRPSSRGGRQTPLAVRPLGRPPRHGPTGRRLPLGYRPRKATIHRIPV